MRIVIGVVFIAALLGGAANVVAGEEPRCDPASKIWQFKDGALSAGEDPIASGITATIDLCHGQHEVQAAFQHEQSWLMLGKRYSSKRGDLLISASAGHFQGALWGGPYLSGQVKLGPIKVGTLQWPGIFSWAPDSRRTPEGLHSRVVWLSQGSLAVGPLSVSLSRLKFLDDQINWLPGATISRQLTRELGVTASMTRDRNTKRWLPLIGISWTPS